MLPVVAHVPILVTAAPDAVLSDNAPPVPDKMVVLLVVVLLPRLTVFIPAPSPTDIVCVPVPPIVTDPVELPVFILVAKFDPSFKLTAPPKTVIP